MLSIILRILLVPIVGLLGYGVYIIQDIFRWDISNLSFYHSHPNSLVLALYGHTSPMDAIYVEGWYLYLRYKYGMRVKAVTFKKFKNKFPFFTHKMIYFMDEEIASNHVDDQIIEYNLSVFIEGVTTPEDKCYHNFYQLALNKKSDLLVGFMNWKNRSLDLKLMTYPTYSKKDVLDCLKDGVERIGINNICLYPLNLSKIKFE